MRAFVHRQWRQFATIFRPPFTGMWVAFLLYFVWCFLVYPHSQTLRADLPDSDDYMYLTQVLDWLRGQGWYNNIQHRLDPPVYGIGGDPIPFSRLPQIPMAALTLFFEWLGLGPTGAATVGALIWPPCLLAGFFMALRWLAAAFVPRDWAGASAFVLIFAPPTLFLFMPGHVDHHGLDLLLTTLALGGAVHMIREPEKPGWALIAGLMLALDLAIALEILPWLILTGAAVALWAMVEGRAAARSGLAFGLALFLGSALLLALAKPPAAFFAPDLLGYSIVYVLFTASIALVLAGIALVADDRLGWRMLAGLGLAGASAWLFFGRFPALLSGPFGAVNPILAKLMLNGLNESEALAKAGRTWPWIISRTLNGWLGLGIALYALWRARGRDLWLWGLVGALVATAILLTVFYQFRFITALGVFAAVPLTVLLQRGWRRIGASLKGRGKMLAEIGLLLVVGPLTTVLVPALIDGRSFSSGVLLYPAYGTSAATNCDTYGLVRALKGRALGGDRPHIIMNTMDIGPELLFRTDDEVLAAPYHTDVNGNLDAWRFFATTDPAQAEAIARRRHADLVISCFMIPRIYVGDAGSGMPLNFDLNGNPIAPLTHRAGGKAAAPKPRLIQLLAMGRPPSWLQHILIPNAPNFLVYRVKLPKREAARPHRARRAATRK